ncbi:antibiotic biosynthesis monooxygenase [Amycolatopsis acidiphila]|uniref:Antibiotic biosynthesis monooxygenase n=1 Tax=Amycolatopsis acidiphila TaxID=715473 RepID=A0A558ALD9_9PSEU|nr:putative quinol monooxygenase [Amycolatopsis acidiphila]TVT25087.1 antibiotic biosynthesis monooxygenase [Amycolatopsis acidiphila]UIJ57401.1 antibiotic biosynthesis monooxygenase [Amycolatopsis acidiphila]GHG84422.1 antibiotic biosynthesis monooxygenase [Amycolatopsis acidiphila]
MSALQVIARHTIAPGKEEEILGFYPKLVEAALTEPGCLGFEAYRRLGSEREIVLLERYASREAFADHRETTHFKELVLGEIVPRLENRVIEMYDVTD